MPNCKSNHLIADHLGWFDDDSVSIEDIMKEKGQEITKIGNVMVNLLLKVN